MLQQCGAVGARNKFSSNNGESAADPSLRASARIASTRCHGRFMVKGVITLGLVAVCVLVALALGFVRDYRSLTDERVEPQSADGLSGAFEALPWNGGDDVLAYPLDEPHDAWLTRWWLLREARERVDVAYFILDGDIFGLSFLGALLAAADRGVQVRILVDGMATDMADMTHTLLG